MKKYQIVVALGCLVFFTAAEGAIAAGVKLGGAPIGPDVVSYIYGDVGADFESEILDSLSPPLADQMNGYGQFYVAGGESLVSGKIVLTPGTSGYVGHAGDTFDLIVTGEAWLTDFTTFPPEKVLLPEGTLDIDPGFVVDTSGIPLASPGLYWEEHRSPTGLTLRIVGEPGTSVVPEPEPPVVPEPVAPVVPEPVAPVAPEPEPVVVPEPVAPVVPEPEPVVVPEPEPPVMPTPEPVVVPEPQPPVVPEPEPPIVPEPVAPVAPEPEPVLVPEPEPPVMPEPEPPVAPEPEPPVMPEPEPVVVPEPEPPVVHEPAPGVVPEPGYEFELPEDWQPGDDIPFILLPPPKDGWNKPGDDFYVYEGGRLYTFWLADYCLEGSPGDELRERGPITADFPPNDMYVCYADSAGFGRQLQVLGTQADGGGEVPEPRTLVLLITGGLVLVLQVWRRKVTGSLF